MRRHICLIDGVVCPGSQSSKSQQGYTPELAGFHTAFFARASLATIDPIVRTTSRSIIPSQVRTA